MKKDKEYSSERSSAEEDFCKIVKNVAVKYAKLVEERIDSIENGLTGTDLREIYDGIQMLGHITATLERVSRI